MAIVRFFAKKHPRSGPQSGPRGIQIDKQKMLWHQRVQLQITTRMKSNSNYGS